MDIVGIILICVIFAAAAGGVFAFFKIKAKMREASQTFFGTDSFIEGYKNQQSVLADTPRSIPSMTGIYLPQIQRDFPDFNYTQFKASAQSVLLSFLNCIESKSEYSGGHASQNLHNQVKAIVDDLTSGGFTVKYDSPKIHRTEIARYVKAKGICSVYFQSAIEYYYSKYDQSGKITDGSEDLKRQTVYEIELNYIQDAAKANAGTTNNALGVTCPNCGAPVTNLGSKYCEYCGTGIKEINIYSWSFNSVSEVIK
ncbi:MAG: zinc ribbon domain-containing protein [Acutalibacteraceae bacterium]